MNIDLDMLRGLKRRGVNFWVSTVNGLVDITVEQVISYMNAEDEPGRMAIALSTSEYNTVHYLKYLKDKSVQCSGYTKGDQPRDCRKMVRIKKHMTLGEWKHRMGHYCNLHKHQDWR
jgi:hypothetical protein